MTFSSSALHLWDTGGLTVSAVQDSSNQTASPQVWMYRSSDSSTDIGGVAGYFAGVGTPVPTDLRQAPTGGTGTLGMRTGDLLFNVPNSLANTQQPRMHIVTASTAAASTTSSSWWRAGWNCTVTST
jgi:hypothetical protein